MSWYWKLEKKKSFGGGEGCGGQLKLGVQGKRGRRILDLDGQGGSGVLKIGQFWWTSYVNHPLVDYNMRNVF